MRDALEVERDRTALRLKAAWAYRTKVELPVSVRTGLLDLQGAPPSPELERVAAQLGWSPLEADIWATMASLHLAPELALQVGELIGQFGRTAPSIALLAQLLSHRHPPLAVEAAFGPTRRLVEQCVVAVHDEGQPFSERRVSLDSELLHDVLSGAAPRLHHDLTGFAFLLSQPQSPAPSLPLGLDAKLSHEIISKTPLTIALEGRPGWGRKQVAANLFRGPLVVLELDDLDGRADVLRLVKLTLREALRLDAAPYVELTQALDEHGAHTQAAKGGEDEAPSASRHAVRPSARERRLMVDLVSRFAGVCFFGVLPEDQTQLGDQRRAVARAQVPAPTLDEQARGWEVAVSRRGLSVDAQVMARRFPLTPRSIRRVSERADERRRAGTSVSESVLYDDAREGLRQDTGQLARALVTELQWDDLILPPAMLVEIHEVLEYARSRDVLFTRYGMKKWGKGGFHILLAGEPGTGKTTIATLLGKELQRETLQVNLDQVFSRYIGETEKHLVQVFGLAERSRSLLLLDEADALLARRTEVKGANDRFGNLAVNVVLQLMEQYDVVSVATTNRESGLDDASLRRFAYRFTIASPDAGERARLFERMVPRGVEIDASIDWSVIGERVELTGGLIKNVMMRASALAAQNSDRLTAALLAAAINRELKQLGRLPIRL